MAPPTVVSSQSGDWSTTTSPKTLSVTTQVGDVLLVLFDAADADRIAPALPTNTGTAETWTQKQNLGTATSTSRVAAYTCTCAAAQTTTVSLTATGFATIPWAFTLGQYRGSTGIGATISANSASSSTACSMALTTTGANSMIGMNFSDWNANDGATRTWRTVDSVVLTETTYYRNTTDYAVYGGRDLDSAAAGAKTLGLTVPATMRWSGVAVEILGGAGAAAYPFGITTPTPRYR